MHKQLPRFVLGVLALLGTHAMAAIQNRMILPDDVVPDAYRIAITPHIAEATFEGRVEIDVQVRRRTDRIVLDSAELAFASANRPPSNPQMMPVSNTASHACPSGRLACTWPKYE